MYSNTNTPARQVSTRIRRLALRVLLLAALTLGMAPPVGAALQVTTPVTVTIAYIRQIGDDFDPTSLGDFYARATINGGFHSTFDDRFSFDGGYIVPTGPLVHDPLWVMTEDVPFGTDSVPVKIEILDDDLLTGNELADINPGSKEVVDLVVDMSTGQWSGDVNWPQSCTSGPFDLDSRSVEVCFDISVLSATGDADEDGLLDSWEMLGFNAGADDTIDVNLPALGANPLRKDLFVELDCVVAVSHAHCPRQDAMTDVVQSFANAPVFNPDGTTGVQLHVDVGPLYGAGLIFPVPGTGGVTGNLGDMGGGGNQIPEAGNEVINSFDESTGSGTWFQSLKEDFFDPQRIFLFRYGIFGHQTNARRAVNDCTSGEADRAPGFNFMVTLGGVDNDGDACHVTDLNGFSVGSRAEQGGTFMHELGHVIGLSHGGNENTNKKPNYLSVMSYAFQDCLVPASPNGALPGGCDYSRIELPALVETDLDECRGLDGGQLGFGPSDWDGDGLLEGISTCQIINQNTTADLNNDGICIEPGSNGTRDSMLAGDDFTDRQKVTDGRDRVCDTTKAGDDVQKTAVGSTPSQPGTLNGAEDWNALIFSLLEVAGAGQSGSSPVDDEPDPESVQEARDYLAELLAPGVVVDMTGPASAVPGDILTYTVEITNQGDGPALNMALTNTRPDGSTQVFDVGAVVVGDLVTRTSNFTVPPDACPGDYTGASASAVFQDIVSNQFTAADSAPLEILDVAAPTLTLTATPEVLWPPDHKFQDVAVTVTVADNCDPDPTVTLVSIISNEPETGFLGNGDKGPDVQGALFGTDDRAFSLRAERRTGGLNTGRVYTITFRATDMYGNSTEATVTVSVPTSYSDIQ